MSPPFDRACTLLRRLLADRRGFSAVLTGLALTMLVGFVGLAVDVGMWQWTQRDMQEAADHAAYAAAQSAVVLNPGFSSGGSIGYTITHGSTPVDAGTSIQTGFSVAVAGLGLSPSTFTQSSALPNTAMGGGSCYSSPLAAQQGYTAAANVIQICVIYGQNTLQANNYAWQVTITQPRPLWFSKILFSTASTISVSAIAEPKSENAQTCVIALNPSQSATGLLIEGNAETANVTLTNCDTIVASAYTDALETNSAANFSSRAVYVGGGELNNGLTFTPGPGAAQNFQNLTSLGATFLGNPYSGYAPPSGNAAPAGAPPGTPNSGSPSPTGGHYGNGCDYYTGDYNLGGQPTPPVVGDEVHVNLPPENDPNLAADLASRKYDGPGVYCQNTSDPSSPPYFVPWNGSMMPAGLYILYGVGMQLPSIPIGTVTMNYTCQNSGDTYSATTGTCNNAQAKPQADSPSGQCSGGGVDATAGVTIYVTPLTNAAGTITSNSAQVQLTPYGGSGTTCFAINAPQSSQINGWSAPTNFSSQYATTLTGKALTKWMSSFAGEIEGIAIQVSSSMAVGQIDTIGPNASIAMNGAFYDPARTVYVGANSSGVAGTNPTTLVGTGWTLNASGPAPYADGATNCSQIDAFQISIFGPANVNLAYCAYSGLTYIQSQQYNFLGSVALVQ